MLPGHRIQPAPLCLLTLCAALLAGCGDKIETAPEDSAAQKPKELALEKLAAAPAPEELVVAGSGGAPAAGAMLYSNPGEKNAMGQDLGLVKINEALQTYMENTDRMPTSLNELVTQGLLPVLPEAPEGKYYAIDLEGKSVAIRDK